MQGYIQTPILRSVKSGCMSLFRGQAPRNPQKQKQGSMAVRDKIYKVRLSSEEVEMLKDGNVQNIARFLRESGLNSINKKEQKNVYSKLDREFLLELSRIGNNINQIAKAVNIDIAKGEPLEAIKLLHLLIAINENLEELKK